MSISIVIAKEEHFKYAQIICDTIEQSALMRGTELPNVHLNTSKKKMESKDAVIALDNGNLAGFVTSKAGRKATM
jgi:hypothetical protein